MATDHKKEDVVLLSSQLQAVRHVMALWLERPVQLCLLLAFVSTGAGADLMLPWAVAHLIDHVSVSSRLSNLLWKDLALIIGLISLHCATRSGSGAVINESSLKTMESLFNRIFAQIQTLPTQWFSSVPAGAVVGSISRGVRAYDYISDATFFVLYPSLIVLVGLTISIGLYWPRAGILCIVVIALFVAFNLFVSRKYIEASGAACAEADSDLLSKLADSLSNNALVKDYAAEEFEAERVRASARSWGQTTSVLLKQLNYINLFQTALLVIVQGGLLSALIVSWQIGKATTGDIAFAVTSSMLMTNYMNQLGETLRRLQRVLADMLEFVGYSNLENGTASLPADTEMFSPIRGQIQFRNVSFRYQQSQRQLYDNLSVHINAGTKVGVVGATGSGKSTFVRLLQRLYDVDAGVICIDGMDIAGIPDKIIRRSIAVVSQEAPLFHRSVLENIRYGCPDASEDDIVNCARRAYAHEFIERLPLGYHTIVGERGARLSGGERQRIAIARALLKNAPIVVFDEATSALDNDTQDKVQRSIAHDLEGKTCIIVAHRLHTIRDVDLILVFKEGNIIEMGSHGDLVSAGGEYHKLVQHAYQDKIPPVWSRADGQDRVRQN